MPASRSARTSRSSDSTASQSTSGAIVASTSTSRHACTATSGTPRSTAASTAKASAAVLPGEPSTPTTTGSGRGTAGSVSAPRTTTTGHAARADRATATEPRSRPVKPPRPRSPSTTSSARSDSPASTAAGSPSTSACSTASPDAAADAAARGGRQVPEHHVAQHRARVDTQPGVADESPCGPGVRGHQPQRQAPPRRLRRGPADRRQRALRAVDPGHDRASATDLGHRRALSHRRGRAVGVGVRHHGHRGRRVQDALQADRAEHRAAEPAEPSVADDQKVRLRGLPDQHRRRRPGHRPHVDRHTGQGLAAVGDHGVDHVPADLLQVLAQLADQRRRHAVGGRPVPGLRDRPHDPHPAPPARGLVHRVFQRRARAVRPVDAARRSCFACPCPHRPLSHHIVIAGDRRVIA